MGQPKWDPCEAQLHSPYETHICMFAGNSSLLQQESTPLQGLLWNAEKYSDILKACISKGKVFSNIFQCPYVNWQNKLNKGMSATASEPNCINGATLLKRSHGPAFCDFF